MSQLNQHLIQIYMQVKGEPQEQYGGLAHSNHGISLFTFLELSKQLSFPWSQMNEQPQLLYVELD